MRKVIGLCSVFVLFFSSCVSKKKHLELVNQLETQYNNDLSFKQTAIQDLQKIEFDLRLDLAERKGEINILNVVRKELEVQIADLETQIENLSTSASDQETQLKSKVSGLQKQIGALEKKLSSIGTLIEGLDLKLNEIKEVLNPIVREGIQLENSQSGLVITMEESLLFKTDQTEITPAGAGILDTFSNLMDPFLRFEISISVHTDTDKPNKKFADNWEFTMLRASKLMSFFTEEMGFSSNRLSGSGKSAYFPKASNSTTEGKNSNRRIEFLIRPTESFLIREIRMLLN
jgi:chemotaxis protein MotB